MKMEDEILNLKIRIVEMDHYGRRPTVEIYGIPETKDENVAGLVVSVFKAHKVDIQESDIIVCHRLRKFPD